MPLDLLKTLTDVQQFLSERTAQPVISSFHTMCEFKQYLSAKVDAYFNQDERQIFRATKFLGLQPNFTLVFNDKVCNEA